MCWLEAVLAGDGQDKQNCAPGWAGATTWGDAWRRATTAAGSRRARTVSTAPHPSVVVPVWYAAWGLARASEARVKQPAADRQQARVDDHRRGGRGRFSTIGTPVLADTSTRCG